MELLDVQGVKSKKALEAVMMATFEPNRCARSAGPAAHNEMTHRCPQKGGSEKTDATKINT